MSGVTQILIRPVSVSCHIPAWECQPVLTDSIFTVCDVPGDTFSDSAIQEEPLKKTPQLVSLPHWRAQV